MYRAKSRETPYSGHQSITACIHNAWVNSHKCTVSVINKKITKVYLCAPMCTEHLQVRRMWWVQFFQRLNIHTSEALQWKACKLEFKQTTYKLSKSTQTSNNSPPETLSVSLIAAVFPVNVFSAWQLKDSLETCRFTVMSITLPVIVFPYKVHVKLQAGVHSAEHVKLAVTPISRVSGPAMVTFFGPAAREEPQIQAKGLTDMQSSFKRNNFSCQPLMFAYQAPPLWSQPFCLSLSLN